MPSARAEPNASDFYGGRSDIWPVTSDESHKTTTLCLQCRVY
jgi:hypothetical protein